MENLCNCMGIDRGAEGTAVFPGKWPPGNMEIPGGLLGTSQNTYCFGRLHQIRLERICTGTGITENVTTTCCCAVDYELAQGPWVAGCRTECVSPLEKR